MTNPYPGNTDWPIEFNGCEIKGHFVGLDGVPIVGSITFTAMTARLIAATSQTIIIPRALQVDLDPDGFMDILVPATDDPDIIPNGFTYQVQENWIGGKTYFIAAPLSGIEDLSTLVPVDTPVQGVIQYYLTPEQYEILTAGSAADILDGGAHA